MARTISSHQLELRERFKKVLLTTPRSLPLAAELIGITYETLKSFFEGKRQTKVEQLLKIEAWVEKHESI